MITAEKLRRFCPTLAPDKVELHAGALEQARQNSTVNSGIRVAHLMGQLFVESRGFTALEENLNYKTPSRLMAVFPARVKTEADAEALVRGGAEAIANRVYSGRLGNGDEASGDGWKFRGSGYIQLTGRANFRRFGATASVHTEKLDIENQPELAREPASAAKLAFAFWDANRCSELADRGDVGDITARINGPARLGLADRTAATNRALEIWQ